MSTESNNLTTTLTHKDFVSEQMVRWCPGCGDYVILATLQKAFAKMGRPREEFLCVSGIGCSSRLPYYMQTYGIHSIHGRAAAVATGAKLANPDLSVWVVTGDGDCMAIGGNHFIHAVRRNVDMNILIFNNKIYGMTKGQSSPTTPSGFRTKTAPEGSFERTFNIGELAIGAGATFFARIPDNDPALMEEILLKAYEHKGTSVIEILQNCVIFSDGIHEMITGRDTRKKNQIVLKQGEPMIYGDEEKIGLRAGTFSLEKVPITQGTDGEPNGLLVHEEDMEDGSLHMALVRMQLPDFPVAMGVIRKTDEVPFEDSLHTAIRAAEKRSEFSSVSDLIHSGNTWVIG